MVQYAAIDYQPKDAAEMSPPVVETKPKRMMLPDNPGTCVKCGYVKVHSQSDLYYILRISSCLSKIHFKFSAHAH